MVMMDSEWDEAGMRRNGGWRGYRNAAGTRKECSPVGLSPDPGSERPAWIRRVHAITVSMNPL
ncbi:hypothetical protein CC78DRAFT_536797 [Lojkania enalia]|uniref:Uncharacterized protein n=1 Tax=Lojkania enalia TaxID=147567 RepID=A0A9P4JZI4_9PLEO|nr:hypothetical protein CC78DRAFT_536797 [Didymosphaeria enalia]